MHPLIREFESNLILLILSLHPFFREFESNLKYLRGCWPIWKLYIYIYIVIFLYLIEFLILSNRYLWFKLKSGILNTSNFWKENSNQDRTQLSLTRHNLHISVVLPRQSLYITLKKKITWWTLKYDSQEGKKQKQKQPDIQNQLKCQDSSSESR